MLNTPALQVDFNGYYMKARQKLRCLILILIPVVSQPLAETEGGECLMYSLFSFLTSSLTKIQGKLLITGINEKRCRLQKLTSVCGNHSCERPRAKFMCFIGKKSFIQAEVLSPHLTTSCGG